MSRRRTVAVIVAGCLVAVAVVIGAYAAGRGTGRDPGASGPADGLAGVTDQPGDPPSSAGSLPPSAPPPAATSPSPAGPAEPPAAAAGPPAGQRPVDGGWWRPRAGLSWQWQLTGTLDTSVPADVYDLDGERTSAAQVAALHAAGRRVICYLNAGAYENFRGDKGRFPASVLGKELDGWPDERWLDIRRWDVLQPIMADRMRMCRAKGFDAVEPDNIDGYANDSGFPLTAADQVAFDRRLAELAHSLGLAIGLKNSVEQAGQLVGAFDFAINEQCAQYQECDPLKVFTAAGKPVFHVEYELATNRFCPTARALGFSSMRKRLVLDAWREPC